MGKLVRKIMIAIVAGLVLTVFEALLLLCASGGIERLSNIWKYGIGFSFLVFVLLVLKDASQQLQERDKRGRKQGVRILEGVLVIAISVFVSVGVWKMGYTQKDVTVPLKAEIEKARKVVQLQAAENKVVKMEEEWWIFGVGVGVGVGMGVVQMTPLSPESFLELVPADEPIYAALEPITLRINPGEQDRSGLKKVYMAFIKDRPGVMVHEDSYTYKEGKHIFWLKDKDYSWEAATFHWNNTRELSVVLVFCLLLGLAISACCMFLDSDI